MRVQLNGKDVFRSADNDKVDQIVKDLIMSKLPIGTEVLVTDAPLSGRDPWEGWEGLVCRIEDRFYDALVDFAVALGEVDA